MSLPLFFTKPPRPPSSQAVTSYVPQKCLTASLEEGCASSKNGSNDSSMTGSLGDIGNLCTVASAPGGALSGAERAQIPSPPALDSVAAPSNRFEFSRHAQEEMLKVSVLTCTFLIFFASSLLFVSTLASKKILVLQCLRGLDNEVHIQMTCLTALIVGYLLVSPFLSFKIDTSRQRRRLDYVTVFVLSLLLSAFLRIFVPSGSYSVLPKFLSAVVTPAIFAFCILTVQELGKSFSLTAAGRGVLETRSVSGAMSCLVSPTVFLALLLGMGRLVYPLANLLDLLTIPEEAKMLRKPKSGIERSIIAFSFSEEEAERNRKLVMGGFCLLFSFLSITLLVFKDPFASLLQELMRKSEGTSPSGGGASTKPPKKDFLGLLQLFRAWKEVVCSKLFWAIFLQVVSFGFVGEGCPCLLVPQLTIQPLSALDIMSKVVVCCGMLFGGFTMFNHEKNLERCTKKHLLRSFRRSLASFLILRLLIPLFLMYLIVSATFSLLHSHTEVVSGVGKGVLVAISGFCFGFIMLLLVVLMSTFQSHLFLSLSTALGGKEVILMLLGEPWKRSWAFFLGYEDIVAACIAFCPLMVWAGSAVWTAKLSREEYEGVLDVKILPKSRWRRRQPGSF